MSIKAQHPTDKWFRSFRKRNDISLRKPVSWKPNRKVPPTVLSDHFTKLQETVNSLFGDDEDAPSRIFNMDETGWSRDQQKVSELGLSKK